MDEAAVRERLPKWDLDDNGIHRVVEVDGYGPAMGLAVQVGLEAQRRNHHPSMTVDWGRVAIRLVTHDADDAVTDKDVDLAAWIDDLVAGS